MKHYLSQNGPKIRPQLGTDEPHLPNSVALRSNLFPISYTLNPSNFYYRQDTHLGIKNPSSEMTYQTFSAPVAQEVKASNRQVSKERSNLISQKNQLYLKVMTEDFYDIENLLRQIPSCCGERNNFAEKLISYAIKLNKMSMVHFLLKTGANIPCNVNIASLQNKLIILDDYASLMRLGARLEINKIEHATGCAPLHLAVQNNNYDMIKFLLTHKADVNHLNAFGNSPLRLAIGQGNPLIVKLLLENKANFTTKDEVDIRNLQLNDIPAYKMSPSRQDVSAELAHEKRINQKILQKDLIEAINRQDIKEVQLLLFLANLDDIKDIFAPALRIAIKHGDLDLVRLFSQKCGDSKLFLEMFDNSEHPMACAVRHHNKDIISFLMQIAIFPLGDSRDIIGSNAALDMAVRMEKGIELIDIAISQGAQINFRDQAGSVPLHQAIASNNPEIIRLLLLYQANPNAQDNIGRTALHIAAEKGHEAMMQILLQSSADPSIIDYCGLTAREIYTAKITNALCIRPNNIEELQRLFNDLSKVNGNENILPEWEVCVPEIMHFD